MEETCSFNQHKSGQWTTSQQRWISSTETKSNYQLFIKLYIDYVLFYTLIDLIGKLLLLLLK